MQSCCELHCVIKSKRKTGRGREKEEQERTRTRRSQTPELEICPLESKRTEALLNKAMASTVECSLPRNTTTSARPSTAAEMSSTSASSSSKMRMRSVCLHPKKEKRMGQKSTEQWIKGGCGMNPTDTHAHKHAHTHTQTHTRIDRQSGVLSTSPADLSRCNEDERKIRLRAYGVTGGGYGIERCERLAHAVEKGAWWQRVCLMRRPIGRCLPIDGMQPINL